MFFKTPGVKKVRLVDVNQGRQSCIDVCNESNCRVQLCSSTINHAGLWFHEKAMKKEKSFPTSAARRTLASPDHCLSVRPVTVARWSCTPASSCCCWCSADSTRPPWMDLLHRWDSLHSCPSSSGGFQCTRTFHFSVVKTCFVSSLFSVLIKHCWCEVRFEADCTLSSKSNFIDTLFPRQRV